jgi:hypothetical protein
MNDTIRERLYHLLPVLYRRRDLAQGEPLRALLAVLEREYQDLEADLQAQYDNWFIETCDAWVIPYLADLVGVRDLAQPKFIFTTQRRQIANTVGYRRRKGTLSTLEHVLRDSTSWFVSAVEFGQRLVMTQHVNHVRLDQGRTVDVRQAAAFASTDDPWAGWAHTFDVHNPAADRLDDPPRAGQHRGRYQMDQIGLYIWRLHSYPVHHSHARPVAVRSSATPPDETVLHGTAGDGRYRFHPLGRDMQLFTSPRPALDITSRMTAAHVPAALTRQALAADLNHYRQRFQMRTPGERPPNSELYGPDRSVCVLVDGQPIPPHDVLAVDLARWRSAGARELYRAYQDAGPVAFIDPVLGRLVVINAGDATHPGHITVHYSYGFSDDIGGGPYHRHFPGSNGDVPWQVDVAEGTEVSTLQEALRRWSAYCEREPRPQGMIRFLDNGAYGGSLEVPLPPGASLAIVADNGVRPAIEAIGRLVIKLIEPRVPLPESAEHGDTAHRRQLALNGLLIEGGVRIDDAGQAASTHGPVSISLEHCTLMATGLETAMSTSQAAMISVQLDRCIVGPLVLSGELGQLSISNSIIDAAGRDALAGPGSAAGPAVRLAHTTVFGRVRARDLAADGVIFVDPVQAAQPITAQSVQRSYVPPGSTGLDGTPYAAISQGIEPPQFISTRYGDPAYAQLSVRCAPEIRAGATDGAEIGAYHARHAVQAEANLRAALAEYLPLGLRPALFLQT